METTVQATGHHHVICWKSAFAGLAVALVTFFALVALGAAFGGIGLSEDTTIRKVSFFTAAALVLSVFLSAFAGSYYSVRVARMKIDLTGIVQGTLVGSLMLLLVMGQTLSVAGSLLKATGALVGGVTAGAGAAAMDPAVQDVFEDAAGDLKLKSEPSVVAKGVATRLLRGDQESAKNYLAYQASLTPAQADAKLQEAKAKADAAMAKAREAAAKALKATGWTIFLLLVTGLLASSLGGLLAVKANERYFIDTSHEEVLRARRLKI